MRCLSCSLSSPSRLWPLLLVLSPSLAWAQPVITLPPDISPPITPLAQGPDQPKPAIPKPASLMMPRETYVENPLSGQNATAATALGGYGELTLNAPLNGDPTVADVRRIVLYVGHNFTDRLRFYSELEVEHAVASSSDRGEFEIEQAFLDYLAWRPLNFRAGLVLMPIGIVPYYHEPPTFNGVDRPLVDQVVIPSTWRELGAGVFGALGPVRYQGYVVTGFDAKGFTPDLGLREGHQEGQLARAHDWGGVLRVDWEPLLGADVGAAFYRANSSQGDDVHLGNTGTPVTLVEGDARVRWKGIEARGEIAAVWIGGAQALDAYLATQSLAPVSHLLWGGYLEAGYDLLHPLHLDRPMLLVAFARYEFVDTQADMPSGYARVVGNQRQIVTAGVTFRPIAEVAVKLDYQYWMKDAGSGETGGYSQINAGLGFMY